MVNKKAGKGRSPLDEYRRKRDFSKTSEPAGGGKPENEEGLRYVFHKHHARQLHYDLRLEWSGVLKSWAVPKGPSLDPKERRLAVEVEDHPIDYGGFEGVIPADEYGGGTVIVWDRGIYRPRPPGVTLEEMIASGTVKVDLEGEKLRGGFVLVRTRWGGKKKNWLLIKEKDGLEKPGSNITGDLPLSVVSQKDVDEIG
ncbi:DNA polymerase ligase N-terminal domain-containing protein [Candidatus Moduliflexota bacterium]